MARRPAFFISDRTGLTSESMGEALLDQFEGINFKRTTYPFVDTPEKAHAMVQIINSAAEQSGLRPLVFSSIIDKACGRGLVRAQKEVLPRTFPGLHGRSE